MKVGFTITTHWWNVKVSIWSGQIKPGRRKFTKSLRGKWSFSPFLTQRGWQIKPKKWIKCKKYANFGCKLEKLASNLMLNIIKMGKNKMQKIYDKFCWNLDWKRKTIINVLDLSIFSIFVIFIFKLDSSANSRNLHFFQFYSLFWFYSSKKYVDLGHKSGIWRIKSKKIR